MIILEEGRRWRVEADRIVPLEGRDREPIPFCPLGGDILDQAHEAITGVVSEGWE